MKSLKLALLMTLISVLLLTASAIEGSGTGTQETACSDGLNNDNDGAVDGFDSGCTEPLDEDDSEASMYDLDLTWLFSTTTERNDNELSKSEIRDNPSIIYGTYLFNNERYSDAGRSTNNLKERYIINEPGRKGANKTATLDIPGASVEKGLKDGDVLRDTPDAGSCGDGKDQSGETTMNCPSDNGLPDDESSLIPTEGDSVNTITEALDGSTNIPTKYNPPKFDTDMNVKEAEGKYTWDGESDITRTYGVTGLSTNPDILTDGKAIYGVSVKQVADDTDKVTNWVDENSGETGTYRTYSDGPTISTDCTGTTENQSCEKVAGYQAPDYCKTGQTGHIEDNQKTEFIAETGNTKTLTYDTKKYYTEENSGLTQDLGLKLKKLPNNGFSTNTITHQTCTKSGVYTEKECGTCMSKEGKGCTCSTTDEITLKKRSGEKNYNSGTELSKYEFDITVERVGWENKRRSLLNLNDDSKSYVLEALFEGDYSNFKKGRISLGDVSGERHFFYDKKQFGLNDGAGSRTAYEITTDSSKHFISKAKATERIVLDADGPNGKSDGYFAANYRDGPPNIYDDIWSVQSGGDDKIAFYETKHGSFNPYVSFQDVAKKIRDIASCDNDAWYCVGAIDIGLEKTWTSPSDAVSIEVIGKEDKSETLINTTPFAACMLYNDISTEKFHPSCQRPEDACPGDSGYQSSVTECSDPPPGGGTTDVCPGTDGIQTSKTQCDSVGDERCEDEPNEQQAVMEGSEVARSNIPSGHRSACISNTDQCVFRGVPVPEGHVVDISKDGYSSYGTNPVSPDREVCLDVNNGNAGGLGDTVKVENANSNYEEPGAEWFDLDDPRINEYVRDNKNSLIDSGDSSDPNDIAYYYRENKNPHHSEFNPTGGKGGLAIEDDCGTEDPRFSVGLECVDGSPGKYVYNYFTEGALP